MGDISTRIGQQRYDIPLGYDISKIMKRVFQMIAGIVKPTDNSPAGIRGPRRVGARI